VRRAALAILLSCGANVVGADARVDYILQCAGCHMQDGRGLPPEVPSLVDTPGRMLATAAGREYLVRVPGVAQAPIGDAELAAVLNWMLREFSASTLPREFAPYAAREVAALRRDVLGDPQRYRREHWPEAGDR
jgi:mono/diheme cytochrome c family protein